MVGGGSGAGSASGGAGGGSAGAGSGKEVGGGAEAGGCAGGAGAGSAADSIQRSAASADIPRTSGVGGSGAGALGAPPHAQIGAAQAAEAANGTASAVPNTAAPSARGRDRTCAMTASVA